MSNIPNPSVWMISAPNKPTSQDTVNDLKDVISKGHNATGEVIPFSIPEFKVGTLDSLIVLSDELQKTDALIEAIVVKIADSLKGLIDDANTWTESLIVADKSIHNYLETFSWNTMKYRSDKTLKELTNSITQEVMLIDNLMKNKLQTYQQTKSILTQIQRKNIGNLSVKSLNDTVKKQHFVLDSEYLITLIIAIPKSLEEDWLNSYELLTQMVVPRSSQKITQDDEYALYNVSLFSKVQDEFIKKCREKKFVVRDFKWDPAVLSDEKKKLVELEVAEKDQWNSLVRLCKANFSEAFGSWQHLKVLRLFIESILRYGLPPDFQPILVKAKPKQEKKVRSLINKHYAYLDKSMSSIADENIDEGLQALIGDKDYSPVVLFAVNTIVP